jgi:Ser/Thr protein kinase RdoA (MazF antagonist)
VVDLAQLYQLGQIQAYHRARQSASLNLVVSTLQGKYIVRQHVLSEETIAHEHQVLGYLEQRRFPAPRMRLDRKGRYCVKINGASYSVYEFIKGDCFTDFIWWPAKRREIVRRAGRTLAEYHQAVAGLVPTRFKWDGYRPTEHKRWREGDLYRRALKDIRRLLQKPGAKDSVDDFARSRIDAIEQMLDLESVIENRTDLPKLVIHGDYAPWNILIGPDGSVFVLDFNSARLDLRVFDVVFATFWFAWRRDRLDADRAMALQTGYGQVEHLRDIEIELAGDIFRWIMGRSLAERLRTHYLEHRFLIRTPALLERFYQMCVFASQHPRPLLAGLEKARM